MQIQNWEGRMNKHHTNPEYMILVSLAVGMCQKFQRFKLSTILERAEYVPKEHDTAPTEIIIIQSAP